MTASLRETNDQTIGQQRGTPRAWVTFVLPVYNGLRYLPEALDSILRQHGPAWELLIVDDCSTDASWDYLQRIKDMPQVRMLRNNRNIGLYGTLNVMLDLVTTPYTCIMFQDDRLHDDYLLRTHSLAAAHTDVPMLWCAINAIDASGCLKIAGLDSGRFELIAPGAAPWRGALTRGTFWTISGSLTKTDKLRQYKFREDLPHLGDYDFLLRALVHDSFGYYETPLCDIREHLEQASAGNLESCRDLCERLRVISEQLRSHPEMVCASFRLRMMHRLARSIFGRSLGALRRGNWKQLWRTAYLVWQIIPACLVRQITSDERVAS